MDSTNYTGRGLEDTLDIQRKFNAVEALLIKRLCQTTSEDPVQRIQQIIEAQAAMKQVIDDLLTRKA